MRSDTVEKEVEKRRIQALKCYLRAALVGSIAALSGVFAYCVYDGYTRMNESFCNCAKYGAMVAAAFSHPIVLIGALAGVFVLSAVYVARLLCRICVHHRRG
jgi:hypothetical protein